MKLAALIFLSSLFISPSVMAQPWPTDYRQYVNHGTINDAVVVSDNMCYEPVYGPGPSCHWGSLETDRDVNVRCPDGVWCFKWVNSMSDQDRIFALETRLDDAEDEVRNLNRVIELLVKGFGEVVKSQREVIRELNRKDPDKHH